MKNKSYANVTSMEADWYSEPSVGKTKTTSLQRTLQVLRSAVLIVVTSLFFSSQVKATTCGGATALAYQNYTAVSLTCGATNDINSGNATACGSGSYMGGQEALYTFTSLGSGSMVVSYAGVSWTGITVFAGCPTAGGTCVGSVTGSGTSKTVTVTIASGVQYYIMFDTWPTPNSPCPGTFTITVPAVASPCTGTPTPGNTISSAPNACVGTSINLSLQNATTGTGVSYQWYANSGAGYAPVGTNASTYSATQSVATSYYCAVTCGGNTGNSTPVSVGMNTFLNCYCIPTTTSGCGFGDHITNVTFGSINNSTGVCLTASYSDYTGSVAAGSVLQATSVPVSVSVNNGGTEYAGFWADWNQDGSFDATEFTTLTDADAVAPWVYNGTVNVPVGATLGTTRVRARSSYNATVAASSACATYSYGETEDYFVVVSAPAPCINPPTAGTAVSSPASICPATPPANITLSLSGNTIGTGQTYQWEESSDNSFFSPILSATSATSVIPAPTGTMYYRCIVTCGVSAVSSTVTVNVATPTGDVLADPIAIGSLPYSNTINNSAANCWTNAYTGLNNQSSPDIFFTYTATCNGTLNISLCGSPFDTYVHLLNNAGINITSNDDNGPLCAGTASSIVYGSMTAGATYYIVIEGYSTNTGNITLNVTETPAYVTYYVDADGDSYGDAADLGVSTCDGAPVGYVTDWTDCDDSNPAVSPAGDEVCNNIDDNCNSLVDDGLDFTSYYADADGDTYGDNEVSVSTCDGPPSGYVGDNTDCNDAVATANPAGTEVCNGIDDNCNGSIDENILVAGAISGPAVQCVAVVTGSATFSISPVFDATTYTWSVPAGMVILSGQGTNSIFVSWAPSAASNGIIGSLSVVPSNSCGAGVGSSVNVDINYTVPVRPSSISGPVKLCPGDAGTYSVLNVARASNYVWTLPAGMSITGGAGTNVITVSVGGGYVGGIISCSAANGCGVGADRTRALSLNTPVAPASISGQASGVCGASGVVYTAASVVGATGYSWSVPAGATIVGSSLTQSVNVDFAANYAGGSITVSATNECGTGPVRSLNVTGAPAQPGVITGDQTICPGQTNVQYDVNTVAGADSYTWTVPGGTVVASGQGTKTAFLNWGTNPATGLSIYVNASNACGTSVNRALNGIAINVLNCLRIGEQGATTGLNVFPNPTSDRATIVFNGTEGADFNLKMVDVTGRVLMSERGTAVDGLNQKDITVNHMAAGVYFVMIETNGINEQIRVIVE